MIKQPFDSRDIVPLGHQVQRATIGKQLRVLPQ
jgi:hypothetical protein